LKIALTIIAVAALGLSLSSAANAATKKAAGTTNRDAPANMNQPKKNDYGKGMRARWGSGCKMSGSC
jgi:hypothetical protein